MKFGVVVFPGSNCDTDCQYILQDVLGQDVVMLWHQQKSLQGSRAIVLPGGFSYGDYLRAGAVARISPIMETIRKFAQRGGLVIGICNGFQILLECGLLPGAMLPNTGLKFICRTVNLRVERIDTPFTSRFGRGQIVRIPIAHNEGRYTVNGPALPAVRKQVAFRYCNAAGKVFTEANPNGSIDSIAGITNASGNVLGMMPHPERASEAALGSEDGRMIFTSMLDSLVSAS